MADVERMCRSKLRYRSKREAKRMLKRANHPTQRIYRCPACRGWHATTTPPLARRLALQVAEHAELIVPLLEQGLDPVDIALATHLTMAEVDAALRHLQDLDVQPTRPARATVGGYPSGGRTIDQLRPPPRGPGPGTHRGGYASPPTPVRVADLPRVPTGPAPGYRGSLPARDVPPPPSTPSETIRPRRDR